MTRSKAGMLEEYASLRAEILHISNIRTSRLNFVWASVSALIAAGAVSKIPEFGSLALLVVSSGWFSHSSHERKIEQLRSYIRIFIEPNLAGIQWESVNDNFHSQKTPTKITRLRKAIFSIHGIFSAICIIATIIYVIQFPITTSFRLVLFIGLSVVSFIVWLAAFRRAATINPRKVWSKAYNELLVKKRKKPLK